VGIKVDEFIVSQADAWRGPCGPEVRLTRELLLARIRQACADAVDHKEFTTIEISGERRFEIRKVTREVGE
jgi:hypothetical protein